MPVRVIVAVVVAVVVIVTVVVVEVMKPWRANPPVLARLGIRHE